MSHVPVLVLDGSEAYDCRADVTILVDPTAPQSV
jgi:hypothetical protein